MSIVGFIVSVTIGIVEHLPVAAASGAMTEPAEFRPVGDKRITRLDVDPTQLIPLFTRSRS
jgi:hypothetical protein